MAVTVNHSEVVKLTVELNNGTRQTQSYDADYFDTQTQVATINSLNTALAPGGSLRNYWYSDKADAGGGYSTDVCIAKIVNAENIRKTTYTDSELFFS